MSTNTIKFAVSKFLTASVLEHPSGVQEISLKLLLNCFEVAWGLLAVDSSSRMKVRECLALIFLLLLKEFWVRR